MPRREPWAARLGREERKEWTECIGTERAREGTGSNEAGGGQGGKWMECLGVNQGGGRTCQAVRRRSEG
eukprot:1144912-Pelagomonas_calceolata.AAC.4